MAGVLTELEENINESVLEPPKYKVVIYNDNITPVDFVVALLIKIFHHSEPSAFDVTMKVHTDGSGVAGVYGYEIAEQKGAESTAMARQNGFPLVIKVEVE
jgi:ATP-dependent Clp protease adaptor protein ClpS